MFLCIVSYCVLHLLQTLFDLKKLSPFILLLGVTLFYSGCYISHSYLAMVTLEEVLMYPLSLVMGFGVPLLLYVTGKIRRVV
jgi:hypothetical protein